MHESQRLVFSSANLKSRQQTRTVTVITHTVCYTTVRKFCFDFVADRLPNCVSMLRVCQISEEDIKTFEWLISSFTWHLDLMRDLLETDMGKSHFLDLTVTFQRRRYRTEEQCPSVQLVPTTAAYPELIQHSWTRHKSSQAAPNSFAGSLPV